MSSPEFTLTDVMPLIEVALMRSGGLIDLDRLIDEPDAIKRIMLIATILLKNAERDPVIKSVLAKVDIMSVLKREAVRRRDEQARNLISEEE